MNVCVSILGRGRSHAGCQSGARHTCFQLWVDQILSVCSGSIDIEPVVPTCRAQCAMEAAAYPQTRIHGQMDSSPQNPGCVLPLSRCVGRDTAAAVEDGSVRPRQPVPVIGLPQKVQRLGRQRSTAAVCPRM
jgi:hypothetical protein